MKTGKRHSVKWSSRFLSMMLCVALTVSLPLSSAVYAGSLHGAEEAMAAPACQVVISGNAVYGQTLTAEVEMLTFQDEPGDPEWQWKRDGEPVVDGMDSQYTLRSPDTGARISVEVAFSGFPENVFTSEATEAVARRPLTVTPVAGQEKYYGEADPVFTFEVSGALEGEIPKFEGALAREGNEEIGQYRISSGDLRPVDDEMSSFFAANYEMKFESAPVYFEIKTYAAPAPATISEPNGRNGWYIKTQRQPSAEPGGLDIIGEDAADDDASGEEGPVEDPNRPAEEDALPEEMPDGEVPPPAELPDEPILLTAPEGFLIGTSGTADADNAWEEALILDDTDGARKVATYFLKNAATGAISSARTIQYKVDKTEPLAQVKYRSEFLDFLNTDKPERFFKKSNGKLDINLRGEDALSGLAKVEYYYTGEEIDPLSLPEEAWTEFGEESAFSIANTGAYNLYVRATDEAGNASFFLDIIVLYHDSMRGEINSISFTKTGTEDRIFDVFLIGGNTVKSISNGDALLRQGSGSDYEYHGGGDPTEETDSGEIDDPQGPIDLPAEGGDPQNNFAEEYDYVMDEEDVILKASYLDSLPGGEYELKVHYNPCGLSWRDGGGVSEPPNPTTIKLKINRLTQEPITITELAGSYTYGDGNIMPVVLGGTVESGVRFRVSDENVLQATAEGGLAIKGAGTVTLTAIKGGDFNYDDVTAEAKIRVAPRDLDNVSIQLPGALHYTGNQLKPAFLVTDSASLITESDFAAEYGANTAVGRGGGTIIITGTGNYTGLKVVSFDIEKTQMTPTNSAMTLEGYAFPWTGSNIVPAVTAVKVNGFLVDPAEYTLRYENNIEAGTAKVTATAKAESGYIGSVSATWEIEAKIPDPVPPAAEETPAQGTPEVKPEGTPEVKPQPVPPKKVSIIKFTVRFQVNGGKALKASLRTKKIQKGKTLGKLPTPKRSKYSFKGWYTKKTGGKKVTAKTKIAKSMTLYARWKKK